MTGHSPGSQDFPKDARLLGRRDFASMRRPAARMDTQHFRMAFRPNDKGRARLGLGVSRKVGSAVTRNRLKRQVREVFRRMDLPSVDVLISIKPGIEGPSGSWDPIRAELRQGLEVGAQRSLRRRLRGRGSA